MWPRCRVCGENTTAKSYAMLSCGKVAVTELSVGSSLSAMEWNGEEKRRLR